MNSLLVAVGVLEVGGETIPFNLPDKINPNAAQSLQRIIQEECGLFLLDTVTHTCGLSSEGPGALIDLVLCIWNPV
ncbi:MAG TPA: hypothetical protein VFV49_12690, partial [Thermoanaerobaculia bacterium]|nr:hypothetical protein [Thermoanaerobaculia bacterium]